MVDDRPEDIDSPPDPGRARRAPPTIDLEATEVSGEPKSAETKSGETRNVADDAKPEPAPQGPPESVSSATAASGGESSERPAPSATISASISPWVIAPMSGAVAAALVIAVGWMLGWPAVQVAPSVPQINESAIDALTARA